MTRRWRQPAGRRPSDRTAARSRCERWKRRLDIAGAALGLVAASPLLAAAVLLIRLIDGGPALFVQWRVGRHGLLFRMYKLRTMRKDAERTLGAALARSDDDRIIPGCRWMRRMHIDELPQLWNVLRGEMSLVGPRPERPEIMRQIDRTMSGFERRLVVRPGLTGLAQLRVGYAADPRAHRRKLRYDLIYIRGMSLAGDLRLMARTLARPWDRAAR